MSGRADTPAEEGVVELSGTSTTQEDVANARIKTRKERAVFIMVFSIGAVINIVFGGLVNLKQPALRLWLGRLA